MKRAVKTTLTPEQLKAARDWVAECADCGCYRDVDADYVMNEATEAEIVTNVRKQYDGGLSAFVRDYSNAPAI